MRLRLAAICAGLLAIELALLPLPGINQDEVLFVAPYLKNNPVLYAWHIGSLHVPVMSMAYLGLVESWLYWPVFHFWRPGVWSIRLPECVISALTLLIFADLVRRMSSRRVALAAALFLATDAVFVMNSLFETTASVQLLGIAIFLNLIQRRHFTAAFFTAGLLLWDKVNIVFPLAGIALGCVLIYPGAIRKALTVRTVMFSLAALIIGAAPLIEFNLRNHGATFQAAGSLITVPPAEKLMMMRRTLDGRAYEHYMFRSNTEEMLPLQGASLGDLALRWYRDTNFHPGSLLLPALLVSLLALPVVRGSPLIRPVLFAWLALAGTWISMFFLADAGAGPHHTVLVYPAPQFIVAATAAAVCEKFHGWQKAVFTIVCVLIAGSGILLLGQYFHAGVRNGFSVFWTDGLSILAREVRTEGRPAAVIDWGIRNGLQIETGDQAVIMEDPTPREGVLYVTHCAGYKIDEARDSDFHGLLAASSLHMAGQRTIPDGEYHPVFCIFRLER